MGAKEQIKAALTLSKLVGEHVQLSPQGPGRHKGLCPFHAEKTPSFHVDDHQGYFYCFGCKASGDVFKFLMQKEHLSFQEALVRLAEQTGIPLDFSGQPSRSRDGVTANEFALRYFQEQLDSEEGRRAREYLERRGVSAEAVKLFEMGYAPDQWSGLLGHARTHRVSEASLMEAGLLAESGDRRYDRFRGRLMFPIRDPLGRLVGFGGRVLDDSKPKYLNTPETAVFKKSEVLYGFQHARKASLEHSRVTVVEGYLDVVLMHQHGFAEAVATLGTALTREHGLFLHRQGIQRIQLLFDGDAAGQKATVSGISQLLGHRFMVSVHSLPAGQDPADVLSRGEDYLLKSTLDNGVQEIDFWIDSLESQHDLSQERGKKAFLRALLPRMTNGDLIDDVAQHTRQRVAARLNIQEAQLLEWVQRQQQGQWAPVEIANSEQRKDTLETRVLQLLLHFPHTAVYLRDTPLSAELTEVRDRALACSTARELLASLEGSDHFTGYLQMVFESPPWTRHPELSMQELHCGLMEAHTQSLLQDCLGSLAGSENPLELLEQIQNLQIQLETLKRNRSSLSKV